MTTLQALAGTLVAAGLLAGCSSSGSTGGTEPRTRLVAHLGLYGGPMRPDGRMALSDSPVQHERVVAVGRGGGRWAMRTDADGRAAFTLPPGRYRVGSPYCGGQRTVLIQRDRPMRVELACYVP